VNIDRCKFLIDEIAAMAQPDTDLGYVQYCIDELRREYETASPSNPKLAEALGHADLLQEQLDHLRL
jgi:hypothetical protein